MVSEFKKEVAEKSFESMLKSLPSELADTVREKYEADRAEFIAAAEKFKPSDEPKYWAKKSCRKCYGRGTIGTKYFFSKSNPARSDGSGAYSNATGVTELQCACSSKRYNRWLREFRVLHNLLKKMEKEMPTGGAE